MREITNVRILDRFDMNTGYRAVVQKGNVGSKYVYALQLRRGVTTVLRGYRGSDINKSILELSGQAGGHTQTWEFAGNRIKADNTPRAGQWFIGVKPSHNDPNYKWAKQIARVDIRTQMGPHSSNTEFPRLAYLNRAGNNAFSGDAMTHAEAAVSPDYTKFLIATIENGKIGHFTIYNLDTINNALDNASTGYVSLDGFPYQKSFTISNLYGDEQNNIVNSIQGFDIDNNGSIYISSQHYPSLKDGHWTVYHKQIVKIPYYAQNKDSEFQWEKVNLSAFGGLDISVKHSEVESIQIIGENHCYLTVAYHANVDGQNKTVLNRIYELAWD